MKMERRDWFKKGFAALAALGVGRLALRAGGDKPFAEDFKADWKLQRDYTVEVAEAMPAEKYGYKPAEGMRTFGELMAHIGGSSYFFAATAAGEEPPAESRFEDEPTKEKIVPYLQSGFAYAAARVGQLNEARAKESITIFGGRFTMTRAKVCRFMLNHCTHHRGYALPYLRLNGIEPPQYRFTGRNESPA